MILTTIIYLLILSLMDKHIMLCIMITAMVKVRQLMLLVEMEKCRLSGVKCTDPDDILSMSRFGIISIGIFIGKTMPGLIQKS